MDKTIITVGFTPAWDVTNYVDGIEWGQHKVISSQTITPAGKPLNVSKALAWMSKRSIAAGLWGKSDYNQLIEALSPVADYIDCRFTVAQGRTRQSNSTTLRSLFTGLVPKQCKIVPIKGAIRVLPQGRLPFLGTARVKLKESMTLHLRARSVSGDGGACRIQWRIEGQGEFPANGQSVPFELPVGKDWQEVRVTVPLRGTSQLVRIHLPGAKAVEIQSIRWSADGQRDVVWDFSEVAP